MKHRRSSRHGRSSRRSRPEAEVAERDAPSSRAEQKRLTRQAILDAALRLLGDKSFDGLSLREVTREVGIVPTAFYRHFENMDELGLVLVDESMRTMRRLMRGAREGALPYEALVRRSVETFVQYVHAHRPYFQFIARERFGGSPVIRAAIRREIQLFISELSIDLARFPYLERWSAEDLHMLSSLLVHAMIAVIEEVLEPTPRGPGRDEEIVRMAEKQLRLVLLGVPRWRATLGDDGLPRAPSASRRR